LSCPSSLSLILLSLSLWLESIELSDLILIIRKYPFILFSVIVSC
jgi:hypothetical protein